MVYQHVYLRLRGSRVMAVVHRSPNMRGSIEEVYYADQRLGGAYPACEHEPDRCPHDRQTDRYDEPEEGR